MVHGIPCFDLSTASRASSHSETAISERKKWRISQLERKQLKISLPINILGVDYDDDTNLIPPKPVEKDEKYRRSQVKHSFSGSHALASPDQPSSPELSPKISGYLYINDDKSPAWSWQQTPSPKGYAIERASSPSDGSYVSDMSLNGKTRYPGVTKIPEDLPCHHRYKPLIQSRSTHVLESQKTWSPPSSISVQKKDADEDSEWSDASSVYSQESSGGGTIFEQYPR
jgi:hypothetical protein